MELKIRPVDFCDRPETQYRKLVREKRDVLETFTPKTQRLDEFHHQLLHSEESYAELWSVVQLIMVVSDGQARVERGFSINDDFLMPHLKKETLCAWRIVHDTVETLDIDIAKFKISDKMLQSCKQARHSHERHLETDRARVSQEANKRKQIELEEEITSAKKKLKLMKEQAASCLQEADKKLKLSVKDQNFNLVTQSIALRDRAAAIESEDVAAQKKSCGWSSGKISTE